MREKLHVCPLQIYAWSCRWYVWSRNVLNITDYLPCFMRSYHVVYKISLSNHLRRKDQNAINELTVAHVCNMVTKIGIQIALAQMMACCLMAPSYYLHQYYRIIHMIAIANGIFRISISKASLKSTFVKKNAASTWGLFCWITNTVQSHHHYKMHTMANHNPPVVKW